MNETKGMADITIEAFKIIIENPILKIAIILPLIIMPITMIIRILGGDMHTSYGITEFIEEIIKYHKEKKKKKAEEKKLKQELVSEMKPDNITIDLYCKGCAFEKYCNNDMKPVHMNCYDDKPNIIRFLDRKNYILKENKKYK